jgi:hypothetical protein
MKDDSQKPNLYFIQGFFVDALTGEIIDYNGIIQYSEKRADYFGRMEDIIGPSKLYNFEISGEKAQFEKQYENRDTFIHYEFHKKGEWWEGHYITHDKIKGESACFITAVPSDFLQFLQAALERWKKTVYSERKEQI